MSPQKTPSQKTPSQFSISIDEHSRKLVSLLALAAGAITMPQTSHASIFYSNHTMAPITVGYTGLHSYVIKDLPGTAQILIQFQQIGSTSTSSYRFVQLRQNAGAYVGFKHLNFFAARNPVGMLWSQIGGLTANNATAGAASFLNSFPNSFSDLYYAFKFQDSTQGNAIRYGWMNVSLYNESLLFGDGPHLTITGWAFDTTGAQIPMGLIPEPSSAAVLALGALALGSKGLRSWRRNRAAAGKS